MGKNNKNKSKPAAAPKVQPAKAVEVKQPEAVVPVNAVDEPVMEKIEQEISTDEKLNTKDSEADSYNVAEASVKETASVIEPSELIVSADEKLDTNVEEANASNASGVAVEESPSSTEIVTAEIENIVSTASQHFDTTETPVEVPELTAAAEEPLINKASENNKSIIFERKPTETEFDLSTQATEEHNNDKGHNSASEQPKDEQELITVSPSPALPATEPVTEEKETIPAVEKKVSDEVTDGDFIVLKKKSTENSIDVSSAPSTPHHHNHDTPVEVQLSEISEKDNHDHHHPQDQERHDGPAPASPHHTPAARAEPHTEKAKEPAHPFQCVFDLFKW